MDTALAQDQLTRFRVAYHPPTNRLLFEGPGWHGIGTPDEWEARARLILREVTRRRLEGYEGRWPEAPRLPDI